LLWLALLGSLLLRFAIDDGKHLFPADRYPLSPRIQIFRGILAKFGPIAPASPPPARPPTPEERDPSRRPRGRARRRQITGEAGAAPEAVTAGEPPGGRSERTLPTGCCQY